MSKAMHKDLPGLLCIGHNRHSVVAKFFYDQEDPYYVTLIFPNGTRWRFPRDLLAAGRNGAVAGQWFVIGNFHAGVEILLKLSGERVSVAFASENVRRLMNDSYGLVPLGTENARFDWDALTGGAT